MRLNYVLNGGENSVLIHALMKEEKIIFVPREESDRSYWARSFLHNVSGECFSSTPLITRWVLLQGRSEIFLLRRDLLDGFDKDEGNCGSLLGHHERCDHDVLQRLLTSGYEGCGHYRLWTSRGSLTSRPHRLWARQKGPPWKERSDLRSRRQRINTNYRRWHIWNKPACTSIREVCTSYT